MLQTIQSKSQIQQHLILTLHEHLDGISCQKILLLETRRDKHLEVQLLPAKHLLDKGLSPKIMPKKSDDKKKERQKLKVQNSMRTMNKSVDCNEKKNATRNQGEFYPFPLNLQQVKLILGLGKRPRKENAISILRKTQMKKSLSRTKCTPKSTNR